MNKVTTIVFLLIILPITLLSCDPAKQFETEIGQIDSCLVKLDSLEKLNDGMNFDSLRLMITHIENNENWFRNNYMPDTLDMNLSIQMNESKGIRKAISVIAKDGALYGEELNAIKHQLLDLKDDVENGLFSKEQIKEYLDVEMADLDIVTLAFNNTYLVYENAMLRYPIVVSNIDAFIEKRKE